MNNNIFNYISILLICYILCKCIGNIIDYVEYIQEQEKREYKKELFEEFEARDLENRLIERQSYHTEMVSELKKILLEVLGKEKFTKKDKNIELDSKNNTNKD
jgi:hypothetical protein